MQMLHSMVDQSIVEFVRKVKSVDGSCTDAEQLVVQTDLLVRAMAELVLNFIADSNIDAHRDAR